MGDAELATADLSWQANQGGAGGGTSGLLWRAVRVTASAGGSLGEGGLVVYSELLMECLPVSCIPPETRGRD